MNQNSIHESEDLRNEHGPEQKWKPLSKVQRRVVGVLVEKAKTTPEAYPLSLNALTSGCNQKSNRAPQMNLSSEDVEVAIEELRQIGAVVEIQGGSRVAKYKHAMYEWLGVDKVELAIIAELLLRGEQTVGELRGRAGRMEPIADVAALRPYLTSLAEKKLLIFLTPEGRGQMVTHGLYPERELANLKERCAARTPDSPAPRAASSSSPATRENDADLRKELAELRQQLAELTERVTALES